MGNSFLDGWNQHLRYWGNTDRDAFYRVGYPFLEYPEAGRGPWFSHWAVVENGSCSWTVMAWESLMFNPKFEVPQEERLFVRWCQTFEQDLGKPSYSEGTILAMMSLPSSLISCQGDMILSLWRGMYILFGVSRGINRYILLYLSGIKHFSLWRRREGWCLLTQPSLMRKRST